MINETDIKAFEEINDFMEGWEYWTPDYVLPMESWVQPTVPELVKEYNETAENEKNPTLYYRLIKEEYREFTEVAFCAPLNKVGDAAELKELADLIYVIYGYAWAKGWDLDEAVRRVHDNNMGRMYQPDKTIKRRKDGKVEKNKDFPKVDLNDLV